MLGSVMSCCKAMYMNGWLVLLDIIYVNICFKQAVLGFVVCLLLFIADNFLNMAAC